MAIVDPIKSYLATNRINSQEFLELSDTAIQKYMNNAINLLNVYYQFQKLDDSKKIPVIAQQCLFLFNSNIDLNLFYQYSGLTSFGVGNGAVQGSVDYKNAGNYISDIAKALLKRYGIQQIIEDKDSDLFQSFVTV